MKNPIKDFNSGKFGYDSNDNRKGKKTKSTKRNRRYEDEWEFMEWAKNDYILFLKKIESLTF